MKIGYETNLDHAGGRFLDAASPFDVRNVYDLPEYASIETWGYAPYARRSLAESKTNSHGKAEPFRTSGGRAATAVANLDHALERRIMQERFASIETLEGPLWNMRLTVSLL